MTCKRCGKPADLTMVGIPIPMCSACVAVQDMEESKKEMLENKKRYEEMKRLSEDFEKMTRCDGL